MTSKWCFDQINNIQIEKGSKSKEYLYVALPLFTNGSFKPNYAYSL